MLRATSRFGDELRPNYEAVHRTAKRASADTVKCRGQRFELVHCPTDDYERGVWFWPNEVLMTVAYAGFPDGTRFTDHHGRIWTVSGRAVVDARGRRLTNKIYEQELAQTWVVVSTRRPEHRRGDILRTEDLSIALRRGTLEGARLVVPTNAVRRAGEIVVVRGGALYTESSEPVAARGLVTPRRWNRHKRETLVQ